MQFKNTIKSSLILGVSAALFVIIINDLPLVNAFGISIGILALQTIAQKLIEQKLNTKELPFLGMGLASYIIISIILLPAGILLGSAIGILQSPQDLLTSIPLSMGLIIVVLYFFLLFSQSLRHHLETKTNLGKSIDIIGIVSIKKFSLYLSLSVYFSILIIISELTKGVGLVFTLPLLFYANHFAYLETKNSVTSPKNKIVHK